MGFLREFKEFAVKGNVMDLAVAVIIGAALGKVVDSVIRDLIMPLIAAVVGSPDFSNAYISFANVPKGTPLATAQEAGTALADGNLFTVAINVLLIAPGVFIMVKTMNNLKKKTPPPVAVRTNCLPQTNY